MNLTRIDQCAGGLPSNHQSPGDPLEIGALAQRHVQQYALVPPHVANRVDHPIKIDIVSVHLIDHDDAAQAGLARLIEDAACIHLEPRLRVHDDDSGVRRPHRANRLPDKVGVPRCVDHV